VTWLGVQQDFWAKTSPETNCLGAVNRATANDSQGPSNFFEQTY
jgi:hypothetical protein